MADLVDYRFDKGIATLTMDDGKVNVMSESMLSELRSAFDRAEADAAVVVLAGRPGVFSAGYDLAMFKGDPEAIVRTLRAGGDLVHRILGFPHPVVVACTGHAIAQGAFLMLAADLRIGIDGGFKFGLNEVAIGLTIPHYGVEVARHKLTAPGFDRATLTGALYGPQEAVRLGFLDDLVSDPVELTTRAQSEATRLTDLVMAAHQGTKQRVRAAVLAAVRSGIDTEFPTAT
ncbi:crotonase/enoyl-CoA hydratase family protein [Nocardia sp. GCM10030253]|uniref:crotonase/enoyl-CoA hydratase family protein n=1 Tax=Nocardia sp. GCM10030253 TaxID=3273404 RepID=UPI00363480E2